MPELNSLLHRHAKIIVIAVMGLGIALPSAFAANRACDGVKVEMTKARKEAYARLVASAMDNEFKPAQVGFFSIMESGNWSAAYISTPVSDDGVMFFQTIDGTKRFRDVWGGWAEPSERPELTAWARKLGAPADLAKCFAETVTGDE
ncbi:hypothetical protein [Nitratireductor thuwali]|uniref:Uncharacterized protein n=1 Tax=Nitratireductor thuwali TaxID=2267699 RepID=A0ABY5MH53_9HYPH|nr:hypothetical protein NTH_00993 [Nitratireductor thuwali]